MLTKYTEAELKAEIQKQIEALLAKREPVHPAWITHTICRAHKPGLAYDGETGHEIESEHVAFWRFSGYTITRKLATACINDLGDDEQLAGDAEPFLPGFQHLQRQYVTRRDGVDVMVPTEKMTPAELRAKAIQFERSAVALIEHARELRRYADLRENEDQARERAGA